MGIAERDGARGMRALAERVHRRWMEYRRRHPGRSVPINDTLSRILEHDPAYLPSRGRSAQKQRPPLQNPGIFTMKEIATSLQTTVGDLLEEPGYVSIVDLVPPAERRKLRDAMELLRTLFDLEDESLGDSAPPRLMEGEARPIGLDPVTFIALDHDYPQPFHAWVLPAESSSTGGEIRDAPPEPRRIREIRDARLQVVRVIGHSMAPELPDGCKLLIDTERLDPDEGSLVSVYVQDRGSMLGRWSLRNGAAILRKANPHHPPVPLGPADRWLLLGTVSSIIESGEPRAETYLEERIHR
jgi:hypothetical protein